MATGGYWIGWTALALAATVYLGAAMTSDGPAVAKRLFLPGQTTDGHYQIELACATCHTPFEGVSDTACIGCHGDALRAVDDSHPRSTFTDPRNAELVTRLDARACVTCHREHTPAVTHAMGVTRPDDYCVICHEAVGTDRPSHAGLAFTTCASAGCHNYHDNTALYEDFLVKHAGEPAILPTPRVPRFDVGGRDGVVAALTARDEDAPGGMAVEASLLAAWEGSAHAGGGVNCTGCHTTGLETGARGSWVARPAQAACAGCHGPEAAGFGAGKHGMREAAGLAPMRPAEARRPMSAAAGGLELSCASCHGAHDVDTRRAAVDACLGCHADTHSRAYSSSPHADLWVRELTGAAPAGTGVSCATCHLPRITTREGGTDRVRVEHNQNHNLQPNERMVRTVCQACHGLQFSLDAVADPRLVGANFTGRPDRRVDSLDMAMRRLATSN